MDMIEMSVASLEGQERRRLQNRIAQRNSRRKRAEEKQIQALQQRREREQCQDQQRQTSQPQQQVVQHHPEGPLEQIQHSSRPHIPGVEENQQLWMHSQSEDGGFIPSNNHSEKPITGSESNSKDASHSESTDPQDVAFQDGLAHASMPTRSFEKLGSWNMGQICLPSALCKCGGFQCDNVSPPEAVSGLSQNPESMFDFLDPAREPVSALSVEPMQHESSRPVLDGIRSAVEETRPPSRQDSLFSVARPSVCESRPLYRRHSDVVGEHSQQHWRTHSKSVTSACGVSKPVNKLSNSRPCPSTRRASSKSLNLQTQVWHADHPASSIRASSSGKSTLILSVERGHASIVSFLLSSGAQVDGRDGSGLTALHHAARENHIGIIALLLDEGADIEATDGLGFTPLHHACNAGHEEAAKLLIEEGADVAAVVGAG